ARAGLAGVQLEQGDVRRQSYGGAQVSLAVGGSAVEGVDRNDVRHAADVEEVDAREAVGEPPRVGQDDGADRAADHVVPHVPKPVLAGRAEQVQSDVVDGAPAEVE